MFKTILVVDDDRTNLKIIESRLKQEGYDILTATNGEQALAIMREVRPHAILLDIEMPEMNGYNFLVEMRKEPRDREIPVIVQTVHKDMQPAFLRQGVKDYLIKPLCVNDLVEKLRGYFEKSP